MKHRAALQVLVRTATTDLERLDAFILPSTLNTLQPLLLAADLAVKLCVDRAHFGPLSLASWLLDCVLLMRTINTRPRRPCSSVASASALTKERSAGGR